jgi:hypothetical protein
MVETLANWGEFLGGIAVVASLIYVGLQVRNSTRQAVLATSQQGTELWAQWTLGIGTDSETSRIVYQGVRDYGSLNGEEGFRFNLLMAMYFGIFENIMIQTEGGLIDDETYRLNMDQAYAMFKLPGIQSWWQVWGSRIQSPHIVKYLETRKKEDEKLSE